MFAIKWFDLFVEDIMYFAYVHSEMGHSVLQFVVYNGLCVDVSDVCNFCVWHQSISIVVLHFSMSVYLFVLYVDIVIEQV